MTSNKGQKANSEKKSGCGYSADSFVIYTDTKTGRFSTSASNNRITTQTHRDANTGAYQVRNVITERTFYATKRK